MRLSPALCASAWFLVLQACSSDASSPNAGDGAPDASIEASATGQSGSSSGTIGGASSGSTGSSGGPGGSGDAGDGGGADSSRSTGAADASSVVEGGHPVDATAGGADGASIADGSVAGSDGAQPVVDAGVGWDAVPGILSQIVPPTFPPLDCDVAKYGGVGDGTTDNTGAFAQAVADCFSRGGGRVVVPAGTFLTGPIELKSNINLYVPAGSTIKFSTDPTKYLPVVEVSWEGNLAYNYHPLLWAHDATNVAITGGGIIDGNATTANWYTWIALAGNDQSALRTQNANGVPPAQRIYGSGHFLRPGLIEFRNVANVLFDGFTAQNSPFWTIHPVLSTNITASNLHVLGTAVNTDGFDPESCTNVLVKNVSIQVGDDAIAIKAGRDRDGHTYYTTTQNVVIQGSTFVSKVGGVAIGSEMSAGVRNVYVEDTTFSNGSGALTYPFYIKAAVTRGGFIEDVYARRLSASTVTTFLFMTGHYVSGAVIGPTDFTSFSNINIDTATVARTTGSPFLVAGSDATKVATGIHLSNITVAASAPPALATGSGHYAALTATNVMVNGAAFNPATTAP
jgi:polygalacturonase